VLSRHVHNGDYKSSHVKRENGRDLVGLTEPFSKQTKAGASGEQGAGKLIVICALLQSLCSRDDNYKQDNGLVDKTEGNDLVGGKFLEIVMSLRA